MGKIVPIRFAAKVFAVCASTLLRRAVINRIKPVRTEGSQRRGKLAVLRRKDSSFEEAQC